METKEAIAAVIKEDGIDSAIAWIAGVVDEKHNRIEQLESLLKKLDDKFAPYKPYFGAEHSCNVNISFALIEEIRAAIGEKKDG